MDVREVTVESVRFDELFATHYTTVLAYARRRTDSTTADDVVSETFAAAWRRIEAVPDGELERAWLLATARRALANQRRAARRQVAVANRVATVPPSAPSEADGGEADRIRACLADLPDHDREVLMLVAWDGLTHREAGSVLGIREAAVSKRVERARQRLQRALGGES